MTRILGHRYNTAPLRRGPSPCTSLVLTPPGGGGGRLYVSSGGAGGGACRMETGNVGFTRFALLRRYLLDLLCYAGIYLICSAVQVFNRLALLCRYLLDLLCGAGIDSIPAALQAFTRFVLLRR